MSATSSRKRKHGDTNVIELNATVVRMRSLGMDLSSIAGVLDRDVEEVTQILMQNADSANMGKLVKELLSEPSELVCPITLALIDDPVVAQDGYTYERSAITSAWLQSKRSPMTNLLIGPQLVVNNLIKSQIVAFKDKVIRSILSLHHQLHHMEDEDTNSVLSLVSRAVGFARQRLPAERQALIDLLAIQARLSSADDDDVANELAALLEDPSDIERVQRQFEKSNSCKLMCVFDAAMNRACPAQVLVTLGTAVLQARWPLARMIEWKITSLVSEVHEPWIGKAASAFVNMWKANDICVNQVRTAILKEAVRAVDANQELTRMRCELIHILALRGALSFEDVRGCQASELLRAAENLEAGGKHAAGAQVAVLLGRLEEKLGNHADAAQAYLYSRSMDDLSQDAIDGVLRTAPALGLQCKELQQRCKELRKRWVERAEKE